MPGLNKLNFSKGFWPVSIDSVTDDETLRFVEQHLWLIQMPRRSADYDVYANARITPEDVRALAESSENVWRAIMTKDAAEWGRETQRCFEAQLRMFPAMLTPDVAEEIEKLRSTALGWKLNGAGGGGYLILVSEKEIPNAVRIHIRRS